MAVLKSAALIAYLIKVPGEYFCASDRICGHKLGCILLPRPADRYDGRAPPEGSPATIAGWYCALCDWALPLDTNVFRHRNLRPSSRPIRYHRQQCTVDSH